MWNSVRKTMIATCMAVNIVVVLYFTSVAQSVTLFQMFRSGEKHDPANPFREKIVHFDLKGAPPNLNYYAKLFPLLKKLKVHAVLMEYEDMFPYWNELNILKRTISYNTSDLEAILKLASDNSLEMIPLVQTFGHMEFVLKHEKYSAYRENAGKPDSICPSDEGSWHVITEMLRQVRHLHPDAKRLHIGADEAYSLGEDVRCRKRLSSDLSFSVERLKLDHLTRIAKFARDVLGYTEILAWNDMFGSTDVALLNEYKMGELIVPVIWGYAVDVTKYGYFPTGMFGRYSEVFPKMMFGSAFKGANGPRKPFCNIQRYLSNQQSYVNLYTKKKKDLDGKIGGIVLTGWQRYSHFAPLCEIFPVSVPSLVIDLIYLNNIELSKEEIIQAAKAILGCVPKSAVASAAVHNVIQENATETNVLDVEMDINNDDKDSEHLPLEAIFMNCAFPGSEIYDEMEKLHRTVVNEKLLPANFERIRENIGSLLGPYFYTESIQEILEKQLTSANIASEK